LSERALLLASALVLDRILGEPDWLWRRLPHPVVVMGRAIGAFETRLNRPQHSFRRRRVAGVFATVLVVLGAAAAGFLVEATEDALPAGILFETLVVAILLAQKSLVDHVRAVARALSTGIDAGRAAVGRIVGRDVAGLDEAGVSRAAIESLAENFADGTVAPAFWYLVAGLPGLVVFKVASTADSMIGHRSERFRAYGWAAARLDDLLAFLPARIAALLIALAAGPGHAGQAGRTAWRDAPCHASPNAGWPEAAMAGALGLALGGPRSYGEERVAGAWLNEGGRRDAAPADIEAALRIVGRAWGLMLAAVAAPALALS